MTKVRLLKSIPGCTIRVERWSPLVWYFQLHMQLERGGPVREIAGICMTERGARRRVLESIVAPGKVKGAYITEWDGGDA